MLETNRRRSVREHPDPQLAFDAAYQALPGYAPAQACSDFQGQSDHLERPPELVKRGEVDQWRLEHRLVEQYGCAASELQKAFECSVVLRALQQDHRQPGGWLIQLGHIPEKIGLTPGSTERVEQRPRVNVRRGGAGRGVHETPQPHIDLISERSH